MQPVVKNIQNNELYFFEGGNVFKNIRTGKSGEVNDEMVRKIFRFSVEATKIINEFPVVAELIQRLNLKFQKT